MTQAKRSYLDHLVGELGSIASSEDLEFFVDERRSVREAGETFQAGRVVAGESLTTTRGVVDYELRYGRVIAIVGAPGSRLLDEEFSWLPGEDDQLGALLSVWRDVLSGKAAADDEERWSKAATVVDEDLDDFDILPDL
ncbi:hypothetical protein [Microbacterium maritypicum]|uniref:hypothetical protein n=1 Tax=Microbacterium maritypicum TaxID=33918 RepID=UPI003A90E966